MCGIVGVLHRQPAPGLAERIERCAYTLASRGPDGSGIWTDDAAGLALGHRRLAVLDLSDAGSQPMVSAGGRFVLAFNGQIYNHLVLRAELEAANAAPLWRGHSDTETLLAAIEYWGIEESLTRSVGMFALGLWDRELRTLSLARDRFGEKPLYYGWVGHDDSAALVFASELKALKAYPGFDAPVCREALAQYLRFLYVPAPRSIYKGVFKLEPGCLLTVHSVPPAAIPTAPIRPGQCIGSVSMHRWWSLATVAEEGAANPLLDESEALERLEYQLNEAVRLQSVADVPLGAFLSGGVDSSTIVALMQKQSARPVETFTVGFDEAGFDESPHALAVAKHLGTQHHEIRVGASTARDIVLSLPWMYDEPFADSSQIPTHLICQAARKNVTVALSGDGGDELFGGYNRYLWGPRIYRRLGPLPYPLRRAVAFGVGAAASMGIDSLGRKAGVVHPSEKMTKLASVLRHARDFEGLYRDLVSEWKDPADVVLSGDEGPLREPHSLMDDSLPDSIAGSELSRMMYGDAMTYLPDDILCKVDRAAMAVSLETRIPFLDHRVVELAWQLPSHMKVRGSIGKWALRQVLYKHVPKELIERPKSGFAIPVGQWLRGPLREWAESLLDEQRLRTEGYFRPGPIHRKWTEHLGGRRDHTAALWAVLMFQAWLEAAR